MALNNWAQVPIQTEESYWRQYVHIVLINHFPETRLIDPTRHDLHCVDGAVKDQTKSTNTQIPVAT